MRFVKVFSLIIAVLVFSFGCGSQDSTSAEAKSPPAKAQPASAKPKPAPAQPDRARPAPKTAPGSPQPSPAPQAAKAWDFAKLAKDKWEWTFPGNTPAQTDSGAYYFTQATSPGPVLRNATIDAAAVTDVRVKMTLIRDEGNGVTKCAPFNLLVLYFSRTNENAPNKNWPFADKRSVVLNGVPGQPSLFEAKLAGHPDWAGTMQNFFIDVHVPDLSKADLNKGVKYGVLTSRIEFLVPPAAPMKAKPAVSVKETREGAK
jgi:hypothetical protein